jgi:predicted DNA-binding transcriptional regulator YafY
MATQGSTELAEASVGALSKVLALLPAEQRRRAESVRAVTAVGPLSTPGPALDVLASVAGACRDRVRLAFAYRAGDGAESGRYVEPHGLVALGPRYYLVAYDLDRADWRTFRVERIAEPKPARAPFPHREPPAADLREYVRAAQRQVSTRRRVVVEIEKPAPGLRAAFGRWVDVEELGPASCRVTIDGDEFAWALHVLVNVDAAFRVVEPAELRDQVARVAQRFSAAVGA